MKQSFIEPADPRKRDRHGMPWAKEEHDSLLYLWDNSTLTPLEICDQLERPLAGIIPKLRDAGRIWACTNTPNKWWHQPRNQRADQSTNHENTMSNTPTIETKTFIAGQDAANMSDVQIFAKIASIEQQIDKLEQIKAKPRKLVAAIEAMRKDVDALCEYVDGREAA